MKLKELKCPNCGASLEVEENVKKVKCEYCHKTFSVEDDYSTSYNKTKGAIDAQMDAAKKALNDYKKTPASILSKIFIGIAAIIMIAGFSFIIYKIVDTEVGQKVDKFNWKFETYPGVKSSFFVKGFVSDVIESNNKNPDHQVCVVVDGNESCSFSELSEVATNLNSSEYTVLIEYDNDGYVNKLILNTAK